MRKISLYYREELELDIILELFKISELDDI